MNVSMCRAAIAGILVSAFVGTIAFAEGFDPLFQLGRTTGMCLVKKPKANEFEVGVEGRAYPFGSVIQTKADSDCVVYLSPSVQVGVGPASHVSIANADASGVAKEVVLESGALAMYLPNDETDWPLAVRTPIGKFGRFKGRSKLRLTTAGETHELHVVTEMGELNLLGKQFLIEKMRRSSALEVLSAIDESYTSLTGKSGEYEVTLERGSDEPLVTGFRSGTKAKIWRRRASLSDKLAVSVMLAGAEGGVQTSFAYLQGESAIAGAIQPTTTQAGGETGEATGDELGEAAGGDIFGEGTTTPLPADNATDDDDLWNF